MNNATRPGQLALGGGECFLCFTHFKQAKSIGLVGDDQVASAQLSSPPGSPNVVSGRTGRWSIGWRVYL